MSREDPEVLVATVLGPADDDRSSESLNVKIDQREIRDLYRQTLDLRGNYGFILLWVTVLQLIAINVAFFAYGLRLISIEADLFKVFAVSVFAEVVALSLVVTQSLFPRRGMLFEDIAEKLFRRNE